MEDFIEHIEHIERIERILCCKEPCMPGGLSVRSRARAVVLGQIAISEVLAYSRAYPR